MQPVATFLRDFRRSEAASATIEFALMLPLMMYLFFSTIELGIFLTRKVMLERGIDLAVRQVRIGAMDPVTHENLVDAICAGAGIIPDCRNQLKLEMIRRDLRSWRGFDQNADCIDRADDESQPPRNFEPGMQNELILLRACSLFDPFFPTTGLGADLPRQSEGAYAIVAMSAYVVEPR
ncbi:MAG: pilus assembly protein [Rubellimicrobium sp.]|nr:pilus assembly protein [Rubellimicrobium sp.]